MIREWDNRRLSALGKPYRYDDAGMRIPAGDAPSDAPKGEAPSWSRATMGESLEGSDAYELACREGDGQEYHRNCWLAGYYTALVANRSRPNPPAVEKIAEIAAQASWDFIAFRWRALEDGRAGIEELRHEIAEVLRKHLSPKPEGAS